jgi:UDP-N-acetylglucosamine--N-acetylmuramyl-(pentapeptide) pyrophosphoryl-undecaprenol N-acetylglucosamine transferase
MILAGGTGGHVYPALAVAQDLIARGHDVVWMGTRTGLEARVVPAAGIPMEWMDVSGLRGKGLQKKLSAPFMLLKALRQARAILKKVRPDVVLGMGGFASGPGGLMARWMNIPLVLHEQNRVPGTTNRLLAPRATVVLEAFPGSFAERIGAQATGNPLRREIAGLAQRREPGSRHEPLRLLIVGGSLGARALNETVPEALALAGLPFDIRHQTGQALRVETAERYRALGIDARVDAFLEDMAAAYAWADLAVCRAGAMTVSELSAAGLPAILIPYPHAIDDHQTRNAHVLADAGAAILLPQKELTPERLAAELQGLTHPPERLPAMSIQAAALAKPDATHRVADICLKEASR